MNALKMNISREELDFTLDTRKNWTLKSKQNMGKLLQIKSHMDGLDEKDLLDILYRGTNN